MSNTKIIFRVLSKDKCSSLMHLSIPDTSVKCVYQKDRMLPQEQGIQQQSNVRKYIYISVLDEGRIFGQHTRVHV